jgi:probable addiction module antidote protein
MKERIKTRPFDPARYLSTPRETAVYLSEALATEDPAFIADALGVIARAKGTTEIAHQSGLGRESLYKALSPEGSPEFSTVLKVMKALALHLEAKAA